MSTSIGLLLCAAIVSADDPTKTLVRVELLAPRSQLGLESQRWARVFDGYDIKVQIRSQQLDDRIEIKEDQRARLRFVTAVGQLLEDGTISFPGGKRFDLDNTEALKIWLEGLQVYGAAGAPEADQNWGLTPTGGRQLGDLLGQVVNRPKTLDALGVSEFLGEKTGLPVRFTELAEKHRFDNCQWPTGKLALGTVTAATLESVGLGLSPRRLPSGQTELVIDLRDEAVQWPVGWSVPRGTPPAFFAPTLFESIALSDQPGTLLTLLDDVEAKAGVPIVTLIGELDARKPEWKAVPVPGTTRATAPVMLLTRHLRTAGLSREYKLDDAGSAFILVREQNPTRPTTDSMSPPQRVRNRLSQLEQR